MKPTREEIVEIGERLSYGGSIRCKCCGQDDSMTITKNPNSIVWYCFRCKNKGIDWLESRTIKDLREAHKVSARSIECKLPDDYTTDIPVEGLLWLRKYGITQHEQEYFSIGYSKRYARLVLPLYDDGELILMQLRALGESQTPKYLNVFSANKSRPIFRNVVYWEERIVLTEDILSAIKVRRVCSSMPILGTSLSDSILLKLIHTKEVVLWLDADTAGQDATLKGIKRLKLMGIKVFRIDPEHVPLDPKEYPTAAIEYALKECIIEC